MVLAPMKTTTLTPIQSRLFIFLASLILVVNAVCQERTASEWHAKDLPFRALNVTSIGSSLWLCGTDESVAVSSDGGEHWLVKHATADGAVLLNIDFANDKFGYAAGTAGVFLTTEDGGRPGPRTQRAKTRYCKSPFRIRNMG